MSKSLQEVSRALIFLNNSVEKGVISEFNLKSLDNALKKIHLKEADLAKFIGKLSLIGLDFNDDKVVDFLVAIHQSLSKSIGHIEVIHNVTGRMVSNYRREWNKINNEKDCS